MVADSITLRSDRQRVFEDGYTLEIEKMDPGPAERDPENRLTWKARLKHGEETLEYR